MFVFLIILIFYSQFYCVSLSKADKVRVKRDAPSCAFPEVRKGFVINGTQFERGSYPWMVALMYKKDFQPPKYFCGGSLISSTHVVTGE